MEGLPVLYMFDTMLNAFYVYFLACTRILRLSWHSSILDKETKALSI